ncbi:restriction endonuclease subunit S [Runella sp. MFBS21]|uniref:restriction endonuclease subunit S n=1 Tax=Runella sp. MFBS21 TaxID=3034018 RepID=UPI0023F77EA2|nr:restriction endonuclease subunit S [Runella sp. MFBS21]MDF7818369.1 restriction endonuclease subunit S [Runella sp. MFBS21]
MNTTPQNTPFKQTEIGLIPQDWEVKKLGEIGEFASGTTPRREMNERYFQNGNIFWVKTMDLNDAEIYDTSEKVTEVALKETSSLKIFPVDTVLVAMYGGYNQIGRTGILKISACVNQALTAIQVNKQILNPLFLINILNYKVNYWKDVATSSRKDPNITSKDVKTFPLPLPSLTEQTAIATALSDADALIGSLEKLIHKKRLLKQATLQHLLTPKEDWEVKKLGEIGECIIGLTYSPNDVKESGLLVLRSSNVQEGVLKYDNNVYVDVKIPEKLIVRKDDILICVRNGSRDLIGKCALIDDNAVGETFGAFMSIFRSSFNRYVFILFQSSIIKKQIDEHLGATINQITNKSLNSFEIPFPPLAEQTRIAAILSDMDAELLGLEAKLEKYRQLKQGMMQQLLTGKIRLV